MRSCPVGAEIFHANGRTDRHDDFSLFRYFAKAPKDAISGINTVKNHQIQLKSQLT